MLVQGDVNCLHCGFEAGTWVGKKGEPVLTGGLRPQTEGDPLAPVRCPRCQGSVLLTNVRPVLSPERLKRIQRMREQLAEYEAELGKRRRAA